MRAHKVCPTASPGTMVYAEELEALLPSVLVRADTWTGLCTWSHPSMWVSGSCLWRTLRVWTRCQQRGECATRVFYHTIFYSLGVTRQQSSALRLSANTLPINIFAVIPCLSIKKCSQFLSIIKWGCFGNTCVFACRKGGEWFNTFASIKRKSTLHTGRGDLSYCQNWQNCWCYE